MAEVSKRSNIQIWQDVIFAIFIREIRSKFSDKVGISWAVIQPVSFIVILSFIRGRLDGGLTHSMPTFVFMMYGMVFIQLFISTLNSTASSISRNKALFAFRQVQPISAVIANALFEALVKIFVIIVLFIGLFLMNIEAELYDPLSICYLLFLVWLISMSLGLLFAIAKAYVVEIEKVKNLLTRPMFFISGVFFSLQDIPKDYWHLLNWNPILHAIELTRQAAYPTYGAVGVSFEFLNLVTLFLVFFALASYRLCWKQVISR